MLTLRSTNITLTENLILPLYIYIIIPYKVLNILSNLLCEPFKKTYLCLFS